MPRRVEKGRRLAIHSRRYRSEARVLEGRVAVVTAAARGLGEGVAYALTERGSRVALLGLEGERLGRLAAELPGPAASWTVDVRDADALAVAVEAVPAPLLTAYSCLLVPTRASAQQPDLLWPGSLSISSRGRGSRCR
ncbi:SDR family NAD(P)-dependent oxidoreductase [Streptomyces sp. NPDC006544]|uniref:SDR family NAD(P)-dependent oxidoreductase n=1 Tax=Streptomyces sp. NPDC006544 TaxID=3154583 RepID=UPI0033B96D65